MDTIILRSNGLPTTALVPVSSLSFDAPATKAPAAPGELGRPGRRAADSAYSGAGVTVVLLETRIDPAHKPFPAFAGVEIETASRLGPAAWNSGGSRRIRLDGKGFDSRPHPWPGSASPKGPRSCLNLSANG